MKFQNITVDFLKEAISLKDFLTLKEVLKQIEPVDAAELMTKLTVVECIVIFRLLSKRDKIYIFSYLEKSRQLELIEELPDVIVTGLLNDMEADDRTQLLMDLPDELRRRILMRMSPEERNIAWKLLSYPEDSVGRMMTPDFMSIRSNMTASQALDYIRWSDELSREFLNYLFVAEDDGTLIGEIGLADLVKADPPTRKVSSLVTDTPITLQAELESEEALEMFKKYDRFVMPVVDSDKRMIGIVTADDMFDVAEDEATEDIQQFGGQGALEHSYFATPLFTMIKKRVGWLALMFFGMLWSGEILRFYDDLVAQLSFLIVFLPMVISSGGNSGTQSASLVIRGIALSEMHPSDWPRVFKRELVTGVSLGIVIGTLGLLRSYFWDYSLEIGLTVAFTLMGVVVFGALSGALLPFVFQKARLDPAVVSSPFITTIVDLSGIIIFINIARWISGL